MSRARSGAWFLCSCGEEALHIDEYIDCGCPQVNSVFIAVYGRRGGLGWRERIARAWDALVHGQPWCEGVELEADEVKELSDVLAEIHTRLTQPIGEEEDASW